MITARSQKANTLISLINDSWHGRKSKRCAEERSIDQCVHDWFDAVNYNYNYNIMVLLLLRVVMMWVEKSRSKKNDLE